MTIPTARHLRHARQSGATAYHFGQPERANPFRAGTPSHRAWWQGYSAQRIIAQPCADCPCKETVR